MTIIYQVVPGRIVWSDKYQKHFHEGETIDLSHATGSDIAAVLASGAIMEVEVKEPIKKEVKHGKA